MGILSRQNFFRPSGMLLSISAVLFVFLLQGEIFKASAGTCVPTAAYITGVADDAVTVWINGVQVANFAYIDHTSTTPPPVYSFNPAILNVAPATNDIAVIDQNAAPTYDLATWFIDIV